MILQSDTQLNWEWITGEFGVCPSIFSDEWWNRVWPVIKQLTSNELQFEKLLGDGYKTSLSALDQNGVYGHTTVEALNNFCTQLRKSILRSTISVI